MLLHIMLKFILKCCSYVGISLFVLFSLERLEALPIVSSPAPMINVSKSSFSALLFIIFISAF